MKKLLVIILLSVLMLPTLVSAQMPVRHIQFNQETLNKGFTVKSYDNNLWLPIFPQQFNYPLEVKIWLQSMMYIPNDKKAVSNVYWYEVQNGQSGFLNKPVLLSLKYNSDTSRTKKIHFFDKSRQIWRPLASEVYWGDNIVKAWSPVPAANIAVLEDAYDVQHDLTAASAIVIDAKSSEILYQKNAAQVRPIASLSKIVSALVFMDHNPGWHKMMTIAESDNVGGASLAVEPGDQVSIKNLFMSTLMASKNNATRALMRSTGLSEAQFVKKMNEKAKALGAINTQFIEPTGLSEYNLSTARDMARISREAFKKFEFLEATTLKYYRFNIISVEEEGEKELWIKNTNKLVDRDLYLLGGKTVYTDEAGRCLVTKAKRGDNEMIALVLGSDISQNYEEVYLLLKHYLY